MVEHVPVLLQQVLDTLHASESGHFLDCTLGGGGHSLAFLSAHPENRVTGCDRDLRAIERCRMKFNGQDRFEMFHTSFLGLTKVLKGRSFDGMFADLGVSTFQLFEKRGFSFRDAGPLDMRMDESSKRTAHDVVNRTEAHELFKILRRGGVGKDAKRVAFAIVQARPIDDTAALARVVRSSAISSFGKDSDPATVVFQAIRMEVNDELLELEALLDAAPQLVKKNGTFSVLTFHSIEDQLVTRRMRSWEGGAEHSASWPGSKPEVGKGKLLTRKAIVPDEAEKKANPSSRSAKLRVFEFTNYDPI